MRLLRALMIATSIAATSGAHAAAISQYSITLDWSTLAISGPTMTRTSITLPNGGPTITSSAEGWVGSSEGGELGSTEVFDGAAAIALYSDASLDLSGGYDGSNAVGADVAVTNTGPGQKDGWAGGWRSFFYTPESDGLVTFTIDYTVDASVSTNAASELATGGYEVLIEATNATAYLTTFSDAIENGATQEEAEAAADAAGFVSLFEFSDYDGVVTCTDTCTDSVQLAVQQMSLQFDVVQGMTYALAAEGGVYAYTDVNAVPIPAAVWLFGSSLVGLLGLARKQRLPRRDGTNRD
jgi:hypothetical protein